jgi:hypothetical protein
MKKGKLVKQYYIKLKNKRIVVELLYLEDGYSVFVQTKRLISFSDRQIQITPVRYSIETFVTMRDIFVMMLDNQDVFKCLSDDIAKAQHYVKSNEVALKEYTNRKFLSKVNVTNK